MTACTSPAGFAALGLSPALLQALDEQGLTVPTPIQMAAIPAILARQDVQAAAQTGSGKTAAFALPVLQQLENTTHKPASKTKRRTRALIVLPTRELALQVHGSFTELAKYLAHPLKIACMFGGVSINPQMMALRGGADVVVATPGRLLDLIHHNALSLAHVQVLVLDEADHLLGAGFAEELNEILSMLPFVGQTVGQPSLPASRQTLLFSATFPPAVQTLAQSLLLQPICIDVPTDATTQPQIEQYAIEIDTKQRTPLLRHLIERNDWEQVLVFVATQYATEHVAEKLRRHNIKAQALHGKLSQGLRLQTLGDFRAGRLHVIIATDLAARGIDIHDLPVVVNYDLPRSAVDYTHRIGRTGRAGHSGLAISFISASTEAHFRLIENRQGQRVAREQIEGFEPQEVITPPHAAQSIQAAQANTGGIKGKRKSKKDKLREQAATQAARDTRNSE